MSPTRLRSSPAFRPASMRRATSRTLPTCSAWATASLTAALALASRSRSSSFSAARSCSTRLATRPGTSSARPFRAETTAARTADLHRPDPLGVLLAEHRDGAHRLGLLEFGDEGVHLEVGLDRLVGHLLDLGALLLGQRALPVEVEPQITRPVQRTGLNRVG